MELGREGVGSVKGPSSSAVWKIESRVATEWVGKVVKLLNDCKQGEQ